MARKIEMEQKRIWTRGGTRSWFCCCRESCAAAATAATAAVAAAKAKAEAEASFELKEQSWTPKKNYLHCVDVIHP